VSEPTAPEGVSPGVHQQFAMTVRCGSASVVMVGTPGGIVPVVRLDNGLVEAVFSGTPDAIAALIDALQQAQVQRTDAAPRLAVATTDEIAAVNGHRPA